MEIGLTSLGECFLLLSNVHFDEHRIAINNYLGMYDIYDGAYPGDLMMFLCLCEGDLNGEQVMFNTVSFC